MDAPQPHDQGFWTAAFGALGAAGLWLKQHSSLKPLRSRIKTVEEKQAAMPGLEDFREILKEVMAPIDKRLDKIEDGMERNHRETAARIDAHIDGHPVQRSGL